MEERRQPIIIKKIKKKQAAGHGGSWKVAYADFVTALMAFFLLLWLLSMVSEEKRAALSGVLLCYGYVGPLSKNMEFIANEDMQFLNVIKVALLSFIGGGAAPKVAVEFGRRVIPSEAKPTFVEMEDALRAAKK